MYRYSTKEDCVVYAEAPHAVTTTVCFHGFDCSDHSVTKESPQFSYIGTVWQLELSCVHNDPIIREVTLRCIRSPSYIEVYYQFVTNGLPTNWVKGVNNVVRHRLNQSQVESLCMNGTLSIKIRMSTDRHTPIPFNPSVCKTIQESFMDEDSADVIIEVGENGAGAMSPTKFYAHYFILKRACPLLAELCKLKNSSSQVQIPDESPDIFNDMLLYIYGLPVPAFGNDALRTKKVIETANKYGATSLKVAAEANYVQLLSFSLENVAEHLLFADSVNCALLKETALDFIVENAFEFAKQKQLMDLPESLHNDILLAMALKWNKARAAGSLDAMRVHELRRLSLEKGLAIDGTREMMIAGLQENEDS